MQDAREPGLSQIRVGELEVRPNEYDVVADGVRAGLTMREFQIFMVLARRLDEVVSRQDAYREIWGGQMRPRDRAVDVLVRKLRMKLERTSPRWRYIHTRFGVGYRLSPQLLNGPVTSSSPPGD